MTGELTKVLIQAYKDKNFTKKIDEFELPINPDQFSQSFKVSYDCQQAQGSQGNDLQFKFTQPEELSLNFTFDGTGVVPVKGVANKFHKNVAEKVQKFLQIVYTMNKETHKPNFLRLLWGDFSFGNKKGFTCLLTDLKIDYTLFSADGKPLRAKLSTTFRSYIEQELRVREEGKESPDVTHVYKTVAGDRLPLMTYNIYGDASYYLQAAKVNGLVSFRRLKTNVDLKFPPIEKTTI